MVDGDTYTVTFSATETCRGGTLNGGSLSISVTNLVGKIATRIP